MGEDGILFFVRGALHDGEVALFGGAVMELFDQ